MGYDAMAKDISSAPAFAREIGKKKRANRSAKLKQCKLDARREQWLSLVNNKGMGSAISPASSPQKISEGRSTDRECQLSERNGLGHQGRSDAESPTHHLGRKPPRKNCPTNNNSISSSGSSIGSCSRSVSDAEEETGEKGGGGLDDWEAVADALSVTPEGDQDRHSKSPNLPLGDNCCSGTLAGRTLERTKQEPEQIIHRAWRPDDVFRPQGLPNLLKQHCFSGNMERHYATHLHSQRCILPTPPSSCPICYEDLDLTDSSFLPCSCGFHLCLFCHKRILEADGRCPGCRKQYSTMTSSEEIGISLGLPVPPLPYRLSRSCSMSSRW